MSEEELLKGLTSGNDREAERAFIDLMEIVRPRLLGYLSRFRSSSDLREDVAQDVLLKLWELRNRFEYRSVEQFYKWIYLSAQRRLIDAFRQQHQPETPPDGRQAQLDDFEMEAILHCANVLWLELPRESSNDEHFRMLLAAQYFYLDKQPWATVIRLLGGKPSEKARSMLDGWLVDAGVLRYLAYQKVHYRGERLMWHYIYPDCPFDEKLCYDLIIASQSEEPHVGCPEGWSWVGIRVLFLRFCCAIAPEEISEHTGCKISHSEASAVLDRCRDREPFSMQMKSALKAVSPAPSNGKPETIGSKGFWKRLAFQYRYYDELPHKDIHERVSPAADVTGYQDFTMGALNVWLSNRRLIDQIRKCVGAEEQ